MMATVPHITSGLGLRKFQADGFLLTRVYRKKTVDLGEAPKNGEWRNKTFKCQPTWLPGGRSSCKNYTMKCTKQEMVREYGDGTWMWRQIGLKETVPMCTQLVATVRLWMQKADSIAPLIFRRELRRYSVETPQFNACNYNQRWKLAEINYRGADKSLTRPTSRCILFDGENISFDASLVIYTGCPRRNGQNFGRVFLMLKYTDITQKIPISKVERLRR